MSEDNHVPMDAVYTGMWVRDLPTRIESLEPKGFRVAEYPDGARRIQGAYPWAQGLKGGVTWRDLPLVKVNEQGEEIP